MADDAPQKQTNPNDEVLAAIATLRDKFTKEFESLNFQVKALEERSVVQRGGDGILQRPPSLPFLNGNGADLGANPVTTMTSTPIILAQQQVPCS